MQLSLITLALAAMAVAAPSEAVAGGKGKHGKNRGGKGAICPVDTTPVCCFGSVNGVVTADCTPVAQTVRTIAQFKSTCVAQGEEPLCCDGNIGTTVGAFCVSP